MEELITLKREGRHRPATEGAKILGQIAIIIIFVALSIHESETIDMDNTAADALAELLVGVAMDCF